MKIRIEGPKEEVDALLSELSTSHNVILTPTVYPSRDIPSWERRYLEIPSAIQNIVVNISEAQILAYCQAWHSKSDVMHFFKITFGEAEEILERMTHTGELVRKVEGSSRRDSRYVYKSYKVYDQEQCCRNCRHCGKDDKHDYKCDKYPPRVVWLDYCNIDSCMCGGKGFELKSICEHCKHYKGGNVCELADGFAPCDNEQNYCSVFERGST